MDNLPNISRFIVCHKELSSFEYDITVDWALDLIARGIETDNILMLASFSKPVKTWEIEPFVSAVLKDIGLQEKIGEDSIIGIAEYHLKEILAGKSVRKHLGLLKDLCLENDNRFDLDSFFLIHYGWEGLEESGCNNYFDGADLSNIEEVLNRQTKYWIDKYIYGNDTYYIDLTGSKYITKNECALRDRAKVDGEKKYRKKFKRKLRRIWLRTE